MLRYGITEKPVKKLTSVNLRNFQDHDFSVLSKFQVESMVNQMIYMNQLTPCAKHSYLPKYLPYIFAAHFYMELFLVNIPYSHRHPIDHICDVSQLHFDRIIGAHPTISHMIQFGSPYKSGSIVQLRFSLHPENVDFHVVKNLPGPNLPTFFFFTWDLTW